MKRNTTTVPPEGSENWRRNHLCGMCAVFHRHGCKELVRSDDFADRRCYEPMESETEAKRLRSEVRRLRAWLRRIRDEKWWGIGHESLFDRCQDALSGKPAPKVKR